MATTQSNQIRVHRSLLTDVQFYSAPGDGDETEVGTGTDIDNPEKKSTVVSVATRPWSEVSTVPSGIRRRRKPMTKAYQFVQLERAMVAAQLLKTNEQRAQFDDEYFQAVQEEKFEKFLEKYYEKIRQHYAKIRQEDELKRMRAFTFVDLERNFLAQDPARDVKIVFVEDMPDSLVLRTSNSRATSSIQVRTDSSQSSTDAATEAFYAHRSRRLLHDPSRAREEVTLFARRAAERLQERLPRLSSVPYRVKIVDERDTSGKPDEQARILLKHKRALSAINKRRHVLMKMVSQTHKNQIHFESQVKRRPLNNDTSSCCGELLEQAKRIGTASRDSQVRRPQTGIGRPSVSSTLVSTAIERAPTSEVSTIEHSSITSKPYQDALSIDQIEKNPNIRILRGQRPVTAPTKVSWVNYC